MLRVSCIFVADGAKTGSGFSLIRGFSAIRPLGLPRRVRLRAYGRYAETGPSSRSPVGLLLRRDKQGGVLIAVITVLPMRGEASLWLLYRIMCLAKSCLVSA